MLLAKPVLRFPNGSWETLLEKAYQLFDAIASDGYTPPRWSLGGGTVLMFHYALCFNRIRRADVRSVIRRM